MQIIPVIDVLGGTAVRAVRGERSRYRPLESQLCSGSDPVDAARALLDYCGAAVLYVADLDGIVHGAPQRGLLARLAGALPGIELWLDAGFADPHAASAMLASLRECGTSSDATSASRSAPGVAAITPVFGSESLRPGAMAHLPADALLSLDRRHDTPLGDPHCWTDTSHWPARLIVMTLERVGSFDGPALDTIAEVRERAGQRQIIGAGGIRNADDLQAAAASGANAWLVASALHERRIPAAS
ncbi:HisA/HisF-related TIM barrel protein [Paraburkholderia sacchari]|uniref:HisA/HisF-related TIM barrel protein n=1 Tax=Paraburkholderia sacchari TaxID=159450 RepID=UPI000544399E|nr:HisA/HisF-related TIM barrel protein [Paraburkholderia sacchari]NLP62756.1 nickel transporter [Paraburkholderia sacchari]